MAELPARILSGVNGRYRRHRPELTLLYQIVEQHYPEFEALMRAQGRALPAFVQREFDEYFTCGRLEHGFLRVRCNDCHAEKLVAFSCKRRGFCPSCGARRMVDIAALLVDEVLPRKPVRQWVLSVPFALRFLFARDPTVMSSVLGIVIRAISSYLVASADYTRAQAQTGAVTLIQRFGSALNLNVHFHMLFLDGVYVTRPGGDHPFVKTMAPSLGEMTALVQRIAKRVGRHLERRGLLVRDAENAYLDWDGESDSPLDDLAGHAIAYRIAVGPNRGDKAFTLQTVPAVDSEQATITPVASSSGFSLHAGVSVKAHQRNKLERLCRYVSRPAVAESRLSLTNGGRICYALKTPWRDGTTHVLFEPLDFIARLAALVPRPRVNLTRFHGIFAPNSHWRARITPARRGKRHVEDRSMPAAEKHSAMTWARRLKRVFSIDIEVCEQCGGAVRIIASIEDPDVIRRILDHLGNRRRQPPTQEPRGPPSGLFPSNLTKLD